MVIGVLVAVAIPTFAGASGRASRRSVELELRSAAPSVLTLAEEAGAFAVGDRAVTSADLASVEPGINFGDTGTTDVVGVRTAEDRKTIRLDKVDANGVRITLVVAIGRGLRFCAGGEPEDCAVEPAEAVDADAGEGRGPGGASGEHRRDGETPAAERRRDR